MNNSFKNYLLLSVGFGILSFILAYGILTLPNLLFSIPSIMGYAIAIFFFPMLFMLLSSKKMRDDNYWRTYKILWGGMCFLYLFGQAKPIISSINYGAEAYNSLVDNNKSMSEQNGKSGSYLINNHSEEKGNPSIADNYFKEGLALQRKGRISEAIIEYEAALKHYRTQSLLNNLGVCYVMIKDYRKAVSLFEEAKALDIKNATVFYNRGLAYFLDGAHCLARNSFESAKERKPTIPESSYMIGLSLLNHSLDESRINNDLNSWRSIDNDLIYEQFRVASEYGVSKAQNLPASRILNRSFKPFTELKLDEGYRFKEFATKPAVITNFYSSLSLYIED